ncbi:MAG: Gfo/Idh/MocA family oxidoreductase, partial [Spirochaetales bacterium]
DLVKRDDIDVVSVYSPDHLHYEHCRAALEAGRHVLCTKPMTNNLEDAKKLVKLVRETELKLLVGQTIRYDSQMTAAKQFYDRGEAGRIIFAEAHYVHDMRPVFEFTPWRLTHPQDLTYGGVCHPVDILRWFLGDIEEIHAYGSKGGLAPSSGIIDNFILNIKFVGGTIARALGIYGVIEPMEPMMKISIYGSKMNLMATYTDNEGGEFRAVWDDIEYRRPSIMKFPAEHGIDVYGHTNAMVRYMKHLEDCILENREPSPGVLDGAKTISADHAAAQSIREGGVIKVFNNF